ncbi:MAG: DUF3108 domain-containing protein [Bacteroidales bacterium]|nr:DUF3108 domain-containing protein [Bacteroidales bacterium]MBN2821153.1 DUF3108 domain-containing protein [Bacteroidales bacterium]
MNKTKHLTHMFLIVLLNLFCYSSIYAQKITNTAFQGGEKLRYIGSYYMSSLWTDLAEVQLEVKEVSSSNIPLLHLNGTAKTFASWDTYFKIRDSYQSWVLPTTLSPLIFKRDMYEGGYTNDSKYVFKQKSNTAISKQKRKDGSINERTIKIVDNTFDVVSVLYYARNLDFENYSVNKTITVTILIDNKLETVYIKYLGKENIKVSGMGSFYCYKLGVSLKNESIMENKLDNNIWLTADENRVPVFIKAEIPVGSVQIRLVEMSGLKN